VYYIVLYYVAACAAGTRKPSTSKPKGIDRA
jgi:hypothetical protein